MYIGSLSGSFMAIYYAHNSPSSIWTHHFIPSIHDTFVCIYEQMKIENIPAYLVSYYSYFTA